MGDTGDTAGGRGRRLKVSRGEHNQLVRVLPESESQRLANAGALAKRLRGPEDGVNLQHAGARERLQRAMLAARALGVVTQGGRHGGGGGGGRQPSVSSAGARNHGQGQGLELQLGMQGIEGELVRDQRSMRGVDFSGTETGTRGGAGSSHGYSQSSREVVPRSSRSEHASRSEQPPVPERPPTPDTDALDAFHAASRHLLREQPAEPSHTESEQTHDQDSALLRNDDPEPESDPDMGLAALAASEWGRARARAKARERPAEHGQGEHGPLSGVNPASDRPGHEGVYEDEDEDKGADADTSDDIATDRESSVRSIVQQLLSKGGGSPSVKRLAEGILRELEARAPVSVTSGREDIGMGARGGTLRRAYSEIGSSSQRGQM